MRRLFLILLLILSAQALEIQDRFSLSAKVSAPFEGVRVSAEVRASDPERVARILGEIHKKISSAFPNYRGGSYRIEPIKHLDRNEGVYKTYAYRGWVRYELEGSSAAERVKKLLEELKRRFKELDFSLYPVKPAPDPELLKRVGLELRLKALREVKERARRFSEVFQTSCEPEKISFSERSLKRPPIVPLLKGSLPSPAPEEFELELSVSVNFVCP